MNIQQDHALVNKINACVERICDLGCGRAYRVIERIEQGKDVPELNGVSAEIRQPVLRELKTIMAVYDARDGGTSCKMPST
jgi:hypothetical protein